MASAGGSRSPEAVQLFAVWNAKWELSAERMVGYAGKFAQHGMNVFGSHSNAARRIARERLRMDRDLELFFVRGPDHSVPLDAAAQEHH